MTIVSIIISYLDTNGESFKGKIEDYVREHHGAMGDTCSRRLRELTKSGKIVKGKIDGNTTYKLAPPERFETVLTRTLSQKSAQDKLF